jgi:hypothetical protein
MTADVVNFNFKLPDANGPKMNTIYNVYDIKNPVEGTYNPLNEPPRFYLYIVSNFNGIPEKNLDTIADFIADGGEILDTLLYETPEVFLENGVMESGMGFNINISGYGTISNPENSNTNSVTVDVGSTAQTVAGIMIVYDMQPGTASSTKHIVSAAAGSTFAVSGSITFAFTEKNLWTVAETVCQG